MQGFDLSTITGCYVGGAAASAIYLGATKIWPLHDYSQDYFTIVSLEDNNDIYFRADSSNYTLNIDVSTDAGSTWTTYSSATSTEPTNVAGGNLIGTLNTGDKLLIKGLNNQYNSGAPYHYTNRINSAKTINIEGNIMSLIYGDNYANQTVFPSNSNCNFYGLFTYGKVVSAENLILPATTLVTYCYSVMFYYNRQLVTAPQLPATTLANFCYDMMFFYCDDLVTAPELNAPILTDVCYREMFDGCSSLQYIKCLATDISAQASLYYWVSNVSPTGTFVKDANTTWPISASGIPSGWTVVDAA